MADINLLPYDKKRGLPSFFATLKKSFKFLVIGSLVIALITALSYAGMYYLRSKIDQSVATQGKISNQIRSLQNSEHKLVLLKDRIDKARIIQKKDILYDIAMKVFDFNQSLPEAVAFAGLNFDLDLSQVTSNNQRLGSEGATLSYVVESSDDMKVLIDRIGAFPDLQNAQFEGFSYTPKGGYLVDFNLAESK